MSVTVSSLIDQTRRFLQDWPDTDALTASVASTTTTLSVSDGTAFPKNFHLEIDQEVITVTTTGTGTTVPVRRGTQGTTAASHVTASEVRLRPAFYSVDILQALNAAKDECFPLIYLPVLDISLTTLANTYEYTVPNMSGGDAVPIAYISKLELKATGTTDYQEVREWSIRRAATPKIQFQSTQDAGSTIRIHGFGPFPELTILGSTDTLWPRRAERALVVGAASYLLMSGEAGRVRVDTLATDDREQANRVGSSMSASQNLYQRFRQMVSQAALPPLPRHAKPTF